MAAAISRPGTKRAPTYAHWVGDGGHYTSCNDADEAIRPHALPALFGHRDTRSSRQYCTLQPAVVPCRTYWHMQLV